MCNSVGQRGHRNISVISAQPRRSLHGNILQKNAAVQYSPTKRIVEAFVQQRALWRNTGLYKSGDQAEEDNSAFAD